MIEAHNLVSLEGSSMVNAIKKDFGLEIKNPEKVINGYANQVYKAILGNEVVFIRINKNPQKLEVEILGYDAFKKQGIPVPDLIAYQSKPTSLGQPTMIISSAEGMAVEVADMSGEQEDQVYKHMGELLKKIHKIKLEGFGSLRSSGGELKGKFKNWKEYWESHQNLESISYLLSNKLITLEEAEKVKRAHIQVSSLDFGQSSLLHRDISGSHVFVVKDKVTGIIDLGRLLAGDPRYDIAMSLVFQNQTQRDSFKKGYGGELVNDAAVLQYLLIIAADKAAFRAKNELDGGRNKALRTFREALSEVDIKNL